MTLSRSNPIVSVTADGVVTGNLWEALGKFEQSRAGAYEKLRNKQRREDIKRAFSVPAAVQTKQVKSKKPKSKPLKTSPKNASKNNNSQGRLHNWFMD